MPIIKILRDDVGVMSLINKNKATTDTEEDVEEVEPYPTIRPMMPRLPDKPPRSRDRRRHTAQSARQPRGIERRHQQRRQRARPIMLDTRTTFERRTQLRRDFDQRAEDNNDKPSIGFDTFA